MSAVSIDIHVDDLPAVLALFDKIQVWRSTAELGTYAEITAAAATKAILDGTVAGPWNLSGLQLIVTMNSTDPLTITFTGTNPLNLAAVIQQINTLIPTLASETGTNTNKLRLTSPIEGTASSLLVSGSAVSVLGLPTTKVNGKAVRIPLVSPTTEYKFTDFDGDATLWYKTRFFSSLTGAVSAFSDPRQGNPQIVIPGSELVTMTVALTDAAGRPIINRRVIFAVQTPYRVTGTDYRMLPGFDKFILTTDAKGIAKGKLVKGATVRVFFEGYDFQREFVVPTTDFNLMDVITAAPDAFSIYQAPPRPIRVS